MRWLPAVLSGVLALSACGGPSAPTSSNPAPAAQSAPQSAPVKQAAAPTIDGIRVTVDGQAFDITGDIKVTRQATSGVEVLSIGKNPSPSALIGGNGVMLELQTMPGKGSFQDGFTAAEIAVATFTVWKGVEFSYTSMGRLPNKPIDGLVYTQANGKVGGSFETDLSGKLGKLKARVEFGVAYPK